MRAVEERAGEKPTSRMITIGLIRRGTTYLGEHLRKNDYWQEGEKEVCGEWIGAGAQKLALEGAVDDEAFEALRDNRNPSTNERLTARTSEQRVAFFDIQISAPKDVSVLAIVGDDKRVRQAFLESARTALHEMERYAAVRERRGAAAASEAFRLTGNFAGALFLHDASRDLDPQLHVHAVLANATWDAERKQWLALKQNEMLRASPYVRQVFYRELAHRLQALGYQTHEMSVNGFSVRGVEHLRERFSKRSRRVQELAEAFAREKGRRPTKREVEILVRESRGNKLTQISTAEVRIAQRAELSADEIQRLDDLVRTAERATIRERASIGHAQNVLEAALRHAYERSSVVREGEVLSAALELHPDFSAWRELRAALERHPDVMHSHGAMTLRAIAREEQATAERVRQGRNTHFSLGDANALPESLTPGQRAAAAALLRSKDFALVLVGDAGTGKTTVLRAIEAAHQHAGGTRFIALAPTTRARDALTDAGFPEAETVQRFLASDNLQGGAGERVVLIDEAGLLSTQQLDALTRVAQSRRARLLLVGDAKQHYSVSRGDAFRNVIQHTRAPVVRLSEVLRQRREEDRHFSRLLANGAATDAFQFAARRGLVHEAGNDDALFRQAAEHYAANVDAGRETLVVIPFWEEIERFNVEARAALRRRGLLGTVEVAREAVRPLTWTDEQKAHWGQYRRGDRLLFVRPTRFFRRGATAEVVEVLPDGLRVVGAKQRTEKITRRQRGAFDVGRPQTMPLAVGDRLLIRGRDDEERFTNGEFKQVADVDPATNLVRLGDGTVLPEDFKAWTYGHALTSYRAQGSPAEESLIVLGEVAERALMRRQFYVGNTRFRGAHRIYVSNQTAILDRLAMADSGRELATEFVKRNRLVQSEAVRMQHTTSRWERLWRWLAMVTRWQQIREVRGERQEV